MTLRLKETINHLRKADYRGSFFPHKDQWFVPLGIDT